MFLKNLVWVGVCLGVCALIPIAILVLLSWATIILFLGATLSCVIGTIWLVIYLSVRIGRAYHWFMRTTGIR